MTASSQSVAVLHPNLSKGGSGAVCMNTLEALQSAYEVTLVTDEHPDLADLNDFFDTAVTGVAVRSTDRLGRTLDALSAVASRVTRVGFDRLRTALLTRWFRRRQADHDLVVSTKNEVSLPSAGVQYVHSPKYDRTVVPGIVGADNPLQPVYDGLCDRLAGFDPDVVRATTLLANSGWTADIVEDVYGVRPRVVHPPVVTGGYPDVDWADREAGFVMVGRLDPPKNVERAVAVVEALQADHPDVHLHVVGPASHPDYLASLDLDGREAVTYEGELGREALVDLVATHRYGLHAKTHEPFGIAVAELVVGGTLPFVGGRGGPREIVGNQDALTFTSTEEAVERISRVLGDPELQAELRAGLPDVEERFGRDRFRETMRATVAEAMPA
jgi:glycosyltransferase involved in cell wall biosynthesis